ncbi:complement component C1q receptor-like [Physella acuta]|uniref:complement component C1q receptor-like n=1 Tax=Physella acuta TaxID=109671 RepID=UPI0027DDC1A8|nr:complement component C1q receptor-like [Physella acuta]
MKLGYSKCVIAVLLLFCPLYTQANCKCEQITSYVNGRRVCSCKPGYVVNSNHHEKCQDIDECQDSNETICAQICTNTIGSYLCSCNPGYKISISDPAKCEDIDECQDSNETICEQICTDTIGSYLCSCNPGYTISSIDRAKCEDIDECSGTSSPCEQVCTNTIGGYTCSCEQIGYIIDTTDITQCKLDDRFCNIVAGSNTLSGTITSPGYPQNYPFDYNCHVSLPPKQLMKITIRSYTLKKPCCIVLSEV